MAAVKGEFFLEEDKVAPDESSIPDFSPADAWVRLISTTSTESTSTSNGKIVDHKRLGHRS